MPDTWLRTSAYAPLKVKKMKKAGLDLRVAKTRSALLHAFASLVQRHRYEDIHVADILKHAHVSRSAFYEHFAGKQGLLADSIAGSFAVLADTLGAEDNTSRVVQVLDHFWANRGLARAILLGPVRRTTVAVLVRQIEQRLKANRLPVRRALILPTRLAAIQLAETLLAPITAWLSAESRCTAQTLAVALRRVATAALAALQGSGARIEA